MTETYETLAVTRDGPVIRIVLNRPDRANALDLAMARDLLQASLACGDPAVRAVVLTGSGDRFFCAGGDLASFAAAKDGAETVVGEVATLMHAAIARLVRIPAPVIAAVNGVAAGAGMSLACACDLAIAADTARFTMAYTRAGLTPDGSAGFFLSRLVGLRRAYELVLTNRTLTAAEALDWGMLNRVVPAADLAEAADGLARDVAAGPLGAFGTSKQLLLDGCSRGLEAQLDAETRAIAAAVAGVEGKEGIAAFLEKRSAHWDDR